MFPSLARDMHPTSPTLNSRNVPGSNPISFKFRAAVGSRSTLVQIRLTKNPVRGLGTLELVDFEEGTMENQQNPICKAQIPSFKLSLQVILNLRGGYFEWQAHNLFHHETRFKCNRNNLTFCLYEENINLSFFWFHAIQSSGKCWLLVPRAYFSRPSKTLEALKVKNGTRCAPMLVIAHQYSYSWQRFGNGPNITNYIQERPSCPVFHQKAPQNGNSGCSYEMMAAPESRSIPRNIPWMWHCCIHHVQKSLGMNGNPNRLVDVNQFVGGFRLIPLWAMMVAFITESLTRKITWDQRDPNPLYWTTMRFGQST